LERLRATMTGRPKGEIVDDIAGLRRLWRSTAPSPSSACRSTGTARRTSPRSTCSTTATR
jgi:hypothetical protein